MDVMISKKDVDILSTIKDRYFDDNFVFSYKNGLNFAVAFTAYDGERDWILDPSYGSLIFNSYSWGANEDGTFFTERKKLNSHLCTDYEFGLNNAANDGEGAKFLPPDYTSAGYIELYKKKFICLNEEDIFIYGDFTTPKTR